VPVKLPEKSGAFCFVVVMSVWRLDLSGIDRCLLFIQWDGVIADKILRLRSATLRMTKPKDMQKNMCEEQRVSGGRDRSFGYIEEFGIRFFQHLMNIGYVQSSNNKCRIPQWAHGKSAALRSAQNDKHGRQAK